MVETEFIMVPIEHWESTYAWMGISVGMCLGSLLTLVTVGLCRELRK